MVSNGRITVEGVETFYREAGEPRQPTLLLLHSLPGSSQMFDDWIQQLADHFHVVAPDLPGFGSTKMPSSSEFAYTFANLTKFVEAFTDAIESKWP
jgi:pimeloyl-ACP methyl ester carboxylesterase